MPARVLTISPTDLASDARIDRQIDFLASEFDVVAAAFAPPGGHPGLEFVRLPSRPSGSVQRRAEALGRTVLRNASAYERAYWLDARMRAWRDCLERTLPLDAVVVNDLYLLPLARALGPSLPIVFDAREHWTSESASWTRIQRMSMRRAHEWILERHVVGVAGMITVSAGIARDLETRTGVPVQLVTNAPYYRALEPSEVHDPIRLVHMGVADERRRLEHTIDAVRELGERFTLDLVLARDNDYRRRIGRLVDPIPNVRLLPPVAVDEIVTFANRYDIGVHLFPAVQPNQVHSLPNKLFDYVQARLAIAIGPSPAMAEIVREWNCGIVSDSFEPESFAAALRTLSPARVAEMKQNSDRAAHVLTAENNRDTMVAVVKAAIARQPEVVR